MKLNGQEHKYVREMCNILKDSQIADELTRIRYSLGEKDRVTIDQVRKSRYKQGIGNPRASRTRRSHLVPRYEYSVQAF